MQEWMLHTLTLKHDRLSLSYFQALCFFFPTITKAKSYKLQPFASKEEMFCFGDIVNESKNIQYNNSVKAPTVSSMSRSLQDSNGEPSNELSAFAPTSSRRNILGPLWFHIISNMKQRHMFDFNKRLKLLVYQTVTAHKLYSSMTIQIYTKKGQRRALETICTIQGVHVKLLQREPYTVCPLIWITQLESLQRWAAAISVTAYVTEFYLINLQGRNEQAYSLLGKVQI